MLLACVTVTVVMSSQLQMAACMATVALCHVMNNDTCQLAQAVQPLMQVALLRTAWQTTVYKDLTSLHAQYKWFRIAQD